MAFQVLNKMVISSSFESTKISFAVALRSGYCRDHFSAGRPSLRGRLGARKIGRVY